MESADMAGEPAGPGHAAGRRSDGARPSAGRLGTLRTWFRGEHGLRGRLVNIGHLLSGNFLSAMVALVGVAITARTLGPMEYGVLALVISYGRIVEKVMRFESWQPLIKYAAGVTGPDGPAQLRLLYAFGLRLDLAACLLSAGTAILLALIAGPYLGLTPEHTRLVIIYALALAVDINGMPSSVLRMGGRYRTVAYTQVANNVLRAGLCLIGWWQSASLEFFVWVWTLSQMVGSLLFVALAWAELHRQGIHGVLTAPWRGVTQRFPGILGFAFSSNLSITLRSSSHDLDVLLVGWLTDPVAAGLYYMAKSFARMVQQINAQVQAVLYPDVARMWVAGQFRAFLRAVGQIQALLAAFCTLTFLALVLFGHWLFLLGPGREFLAAKSLLLVQIVAVWLTTHSAPSRTAMLAMGMQRSVLHIAIVATIAFQITLFVLVPRIGPMGANIAHVVLALYCAVVMDYKVRQGVKKARAATDGNAADALAAEASAPL